MKLEVGRHYRDFGGNVWYCETARETEGVAWMVRLSDAAKCRFAISGLFWPVSRDRDPADKKFDILEECRKFEYTPAFEARTPDEQEFYDKLCCARAYESVQAPSSISQVRRLEIAEAARQVWPKYEAARRVRKRIIYLSGPMKGYPESNYPAFRDAAAGLRSQGHRVYSPAEFPHNGPHDTFPLRQAFAAYSAFICLEADTIVLLPGWEKSRGAGAERALADNCGLDILEYGRDIA